MIRYIFVLPALDLDRFLQAMSRALSAFPFIAGGLRQTETEFYIDLINNAIPVRVVIDDNPDPTPRLLPNDPVIQPTFADLIDNVNLDPPYQINDPLIVFKLTYRTQTKQVVMCMFMNHFPTDGPGLIRFMNVCSQMYVNPEEEPKDGLNEGDLIRFQPWMSDEELAPFVDDVVARSDWLVQAFQTGLEQRTDFFKPGFTQIDFRFMIKDMKALREQVVGNQGAELKLSYGDVIGAYLIWKHNQILPPQYVDTQFIKRVYQVFNIRGASDRVGKSDAFFNCFQRLLALEDDFTKASTVLDIAQVMRRLLKLGRSKEYCEPMAHITGALRKANSLKGLMQYQTALVSHDEFFP